MRNWTISARALALCAVLFLSAGLLPSTVLAHERREVGKYVVVVGFNEEPAIQGELNAALIRVSVPSEGDRAVEGLADTLKVNIAAGGGQPKEFSLRAIRSQPGAYIADFIPTRPGAYLFTFTGAIEGTPINERFESGPGRFDEVRAAEAIQFPEPVPLGNQLARDVRIATERAQDAEAVASTARTTAVAGLAVGILGAVLGLAAIGRQMFRRTDAVSSPRY